MSATQSRADRHPGPSCAMLLLLAGTALAGMPAVAGDLPSGGSVAHGAVAISTPSAGSMAIRQSSDRAIVNWQGFSIGQGARVDITQPSASAAILNRVTGTAPSSIAGQLNANGRVYLVNPNGIMIHRGGTVRAGGGFVASSLGMRDDDFKAGRDRFRGTGRSGAVVNDGVIDIGRGGYAALIGGRVDNSGTISVPMGRVGIGAGERATLDLSGDGFLQVALPSEAVPGDDGALIEHSGRITADGGRVEIRAATARNAARNAINLSGVVEARSVGGRSGAIVLGGGAGGTVTVSGRLDAGTGGQPAVVAAAPPPPRQAGGAITVTGEAITLTGAVLNASGTEGGGTIRVGGDLQGGGTLPRAATVSVDGGTLIRADATDAGDGGRVILWADDHTRFAGEISARGGPAGGDGGFAEVSGKRLLSYSGRTDLSAPAGAFGTLLLDPYDVFIEDGNTVGMSQEGNFLEPFTENSVLNVGQLVDALETANVFVSTGFSGDQDGNITVGTPVSWTTPTTLTLSANGDIILANPVTAPNGGLTLGAGGEITTPTSWTDSTGASRTGGNGAVTVGTFRMDDGDWVQNAATLPAFAADDFRVNTGSFLRVLDGDGSTGDPYMITDVYGLQGIGAGSGFLSAHFALANDIDASGTRDWTDGDTGLAGFLPIGYADGEFDAGFTGSLDGRRHVISGLFIARDTDEQVGLFGYARSGATITDLGLTDVDIRGGRSTGGLVGEFGAAEDPDAEGIARVFVSGQVSGTGSFEVGGLVGWNSGNIADSYSTASVTWIGDPDFPCLLCDAGGLVGWNWGTISRSFATGAVTATGEIDSSTLVRVGGLVGANQPSGVIRQAYARGAVSGTGPDGGEAVGLEIGGLVGTNSGTIAETYATGVVTGTGFAAEGGLVGAGPAEAVTASYWDTTATGQSGSSGGTGLITAELRNMAGFMARAEPQGWDFRTVWAPPSAGFYPDLYALTPVIWAEVADASFVYGAPGDLGASFWGGPTRFVLGPPGDGMGTIGLTSPGWPDGNVGTYPITVPGSALSDGGIPYRIVSAGGILTVTRAPLTITAASGTKRYGQEGIPVGPPVVTGLVNGDAVTSVTLESDGAARTAPVAGNPYEITARNAQGRGLVVDGVANYDISYRPGSLTVTPAPLIITADDLEKLFGTRLGFAGTEFTSRGLVNGDRIASVTLTSDGAPATATVAGSPYPIRASGAVGTGLVVDGISNYDITYEPGSLAVIPRTSPRPPTPTPPLPPPEHVPTLVRQLPPVNLPNPRDTIIDRIQAATGGQILGTAAASRAAAANTLAALTRLSEDLEGRLRGCDAALSAATGYLGCVREALSRYALGLDPGILELPEPLRAVSAIIEQAAREIEATQATAIRRLQSARSDAEIRAIEREALVEAHASVQTAVAEIRKAIELIRADEPQVASLYVEQGDAITTAMQGVEARLSRVVGL